MRNEFVIPVSTDLRQTVNEIETTDPMRFTSFTLNGGKL